MFCVLSCLSQGSYMIIWLLSMWFSYWAPSQTLSPQCSHSMVSLTAKAELYYKVPCEEEQDQVPCQEGQDSVQESNEFPNGFLPSYNFRRSGQNHVWLQSHRGVWRGGEGRSVSLKTWVGCPLAPPQVHRQLATLSTSALQKHDVAAVGTWAGSKEKSFRTGVEVLRKIQSPRGPAAC